MFPSKSHEWWWDACNIFDGRPAGSAAGRSGAGAETGRFLRNAGLGWGWGGGCSDFWVAVFHTKKDLSRL